MPSGRAHPSVGRSCERLRRAAGALAAEGGDAALVARDKTVLETTREAVAAASGRRVIAVACDTGDRATGGLLGVQLFGHKGAEVAKRVDIAATAIFTA
jgi:ethanolamine utilization microcompartment shell protein EutL